MLAVIVQKVLECDEDFLFAIGDKLAELRGRSGHGETGRASRRGVELKERGAGVRPGVASRNHSE